MAFSEHHHSSQYEQQAQCDVHVAGTQQPDDRVLPGHRGTKLHYLLGRRAIKQRRHHLRGSLDATSSGQ